MSNINKNITYRFSLNEKHDLIDINDVDKNHRHENKYFCLSCGKELIPIIGEKRERHFRHAKDTACYGETYIHFLAKELIKRRYLSTSQFLISTCRPKKCKLIETCTLPVPKQKCIISESLDYDLKNIYDQIFIEESVSNFVADILLKDSSGKNIPFLIEIYVTHKCEKDKLHSGFPILEIKIDSEDQALELLSCKVIPGHLYNFSLPSVYTNKPLLQSWGVEVFGLFESGKCLKKYISKDCRNLLSPNFKSTFLEFFSFYKNYRQNSYGEFLTKAIELGFKIKDCRLCSFYKMPYGYDSQELCCLYKKRHLPKYPDTRSAYGCPSYKKITLDVSNRKLFILVNRKDDFNRKNFNAIYDEGHKQELEKFENENKLKLQNKIIENERQQQILEKGKELKAAALKNFRDCFENGTIKIEYRNPEYVIKHWNSHDGYIVRDIKPFYNKCKAHVKNGKYCLELYRDDLQIQDHLFINFLYFESTPILKNKDAFVIFIKLAGNSNSLVSENKTLKICDFQRANFVNIDNLHLKLDEFDYKTFHCYRY